jgi:hypothetical protein
MADYSYHDEMRNSGDTDRPRLLEDPGTIVTSAPEARFKLGYGSIMGLVANRMIGGWSVMLLLMFHTDKNRLGYIRQRWLNVRVD